jgi:methylphosphotriester-DNA--protein-cysteine methyltransferase
MTILKLQLELPDDFVISEQEAKTAIVMKLYENGKLSIGKSAELLGMTLREFIETFGTVCGTTPEEFDSELENAGWASQYINTGILEKVEKK